jgi:4-hydroxyphenylacetate 3-monooxygenase
MIKLWMDTTCGMFGRSPDFLNVMLTGLAAAAAEFGGNDPRFAANIRDYQIHAREHDLCLTHTLLNPQVDRSRPVERQEKDLAAKIVKETDAGIIVTGARMVATLCAYSDDLLVLPSTFLATNLEAAPFDEGDGLAVFDNVLVPWERVFIHRDPEMCNGLFQRTGAMPQVMHQTSTKNLAKAEFMLALGCAIARSTNIDTHLHVQGMLAELIEHVEFARLHPRHPASGLMTPAEMPLWTVRMMFPKMFVRACEIIQLLGAGGLVAVPSYAELSGPAAADVERYAQAANANADAPTRVKLFRLAFDAALSSFSGRQQLYERYYSGDPVRLASALYAMYPKDAPVARIHQMLNDLEAKSSNP